MRWPTNKRLLQIAVYGAIASISGVMYMKFRLEDRVRNAEYYKLAIQTLRQNKGAIKLLGEPIKELGFDISDRNNNWDAQKAQLEVKVKGSKDNGKIFFWASNSGENGGGWLIERLDLELKSDPDKRYLIKKPKVEEVKQNANITEENQNKFT